MLRRVGQQQYARRPGSGTEFAQRDESRLVAGYGVNVDERDTV